MASYAFIVVSTDTGRTVVDGPTCAWGPFVLEAQADEFRDLLSRTVAGIHRVTTIRQPDTATVQP